LSLPAPLRIAVILAVLSAPRPCLARLELLEGRELTLYEIHDPRGRLRTPDFAGGGFSQRVLWWRGDRRLVAVEVHLEPYVGRGRLPAEADLAGLPPDLAERLEAPGTTPAAAVRAMVEWLGTEIDYRPPDGDPETAESTLTGRAGSCQGRTALACRLAERIGVRARPIRGILVGEETVFHRWPEFRLPTGRLLLADPGLSLDFVDSRHLVALVEPGPEDGPFLRPRELGIRIRRVRHESDRVVVDHRPSRGCFLARRSDRFQHEAALVVRLAGRRDWTGWALALEGAGGRILPAPVGHGGRASFAGLRGGHYRLTVLEPAPAGFRPLLRRGVGLDAGQLLRIREEVGT